MNFITFNMLMPTTKTTKNVEPKTEGTLKPLTGFDFVLIGSVVVMLVGLVVHLVN